mmetsp:Transcript_8284/g.17672  ORF Transcript_8284/g.17672 Transcript_8284/m.17672 type:complete len:305 (-) Transcript_8284:147-1061(-)
MERPSHERKLAATDPKRYFHRLDDYARRIRRESLDTERQQMQSRTCHAQMQVWHSLPAVVDNGNDGTNAYNHNILNNNNDNNYKNMIDFDSDAATPVGSAFLHEFLLKLREQQHQRQQQLPLPLPLQQCPNRATAIEMTMESNRCTHSIDGAHGRGYVPRVGTCSEIDLRDMLLQRKMRIREWHREQLLRRQWQWERQRQQEKQLMRRELFERQQQEERRLKEVSHRSRDSTAEAEGNFYLDRSQRDPDGDDLYTISRPEPQLSQGQDEEQGNDKDENRGVEYVQVPLRVESDELVRSHYSGGW